MQLELGKIESAEGYINKAFRRGKESVVTTKIHNRTLSRLEKFKFLEHIRLSVVKDSLINDLTKIIRCFPVYDQLDEFYRQLFSCFIDVDKYKNALGGLNWAKFRMTSIYSKMDKQFKYKDDVNSVIGVQKVFLARVSSIFDQIAEHFKYLDEVRVIINQMPNVKTSLHTVAISGFPNVGKSTLLSKLTDSKPDIAAYAFTTKSLMIGYIKAEDIKVQVIDTPGTLNRFNKMNNVEKMAHLAMKYMADIIVYVFDLTEPYGIGEQLKLYQDLKSLNKKIIVYFSKSDIISTKLIDGFEIKGIYDIKDLRKEILSEVARLPPKEKPAPAAQDPGTESPDVEEDLDNEEENEDSEEDY